MSTKLVRRDYFACNAMQGLLASFGSVYMEPTEIKMAAELSYDIADAMVTASNNRSSFKDEEITETETPNVLTVKPETIRKHRNGTHAMRAVG